jgi:trans-o-hydroxybenzylidenepyruvate hydratase-aldolase
MTMMTSSDIRGVYAIIPTPSKPGADAWDAIDTVDLDETARTIDRLIADGVHGLIVLGTMGECATLTSSEYEAFAACVLQTVRKRIPAFIGTTALGTHEVVRRTRFVAGLGADGILLGMPMWQPLTMDMAVDYYRSIAEGFPHLPIMVYANPRAFRFPFAAEFWGRVVEVAPTVMSAKFSHADMLLDCLAASKGRVNFLPYDGAFGKFAELSRATTTACWSTAASMGPQPVLELVRAVLANDVGALKTINADHAWVREPVKSIISNVEIMASYNIQYEKTRTALAGYCKAGPLRPPYHIMPQPYFEACREHARRWRELCEKYAKTPVMAGG